MHGTGYKLVYHIFIEQKGTPEHWIAIVYGSKNNDEKSATCQSEYVANESQFSIRFWAGQLKK